MEIEQLANQKGNIANFPNLIDKQQFTSRTSRRKSLTYGIIKC